MAYQYKTEPYPNIWSNDLCKKRQKQESDDAVITAFGMPVVGACAG